MVKKGPKAAAKKGGGASSDDESPGLRPGDWTVMVYVWEGRELKGRDFGGISDPVTIVTVMDQKQQTEVKKKRTSCVWQHYMHFEFPNMDPEELEFGRINLAVYDANSVRRNVLIGEIDLDIAEVYARPGHEHNCQWFGLVDSNSESSAMAGYLKADVVVLGPGDVAVVHGDSDEDEDEDFSDLKSMVIAPMKMEKTDCLLVCRALRAEGLPQMDRFGAGCNPFVSVAFSGRTEKTSRHASLNPVWNEQVELPMCLPTMSNIIKVAVCDHDFLGKNDVIGVAHMKFKDLPFVERDEEETVEPQWVNLYGAHPKNSNAVAKKMNAGIKEGIHYRGRVLIALWKRKVKKAEYKLVNLNRKDSDDDKKTILYHPKVPAARSYSIHVDLHCVNGLCSKFDQVLVEARVGPMIISSSIVEVKEGCGEWYESMPEATLNLPKDLDQAPDLLFCLCTPKDRAIIGYKRFRLTDLTSPLTQWVHLAEDASSDLVPMNEFPGMVLCRLHLQAAREARRSLRPKVSPPEKVKYELRAHIYQARHLPAADESGALDPYVVVRVAGVAAKTHVVKENTFPVWYQSLIIPVELPLPLDSAPDITMQVFDHDVMSKNDLVGTCSISVGSVSLFQPEVPTWHDVSLESLGDENKAQVLASFQLVPSSKSASHLVRSIKPAVNQCHMELFVLGVRQMKPFLMEELNAPFVEFSLGSNNRVLTKHHKKPSGSNANFLENVSINYDVPVDPMYTTPFMVAVHDRRLGGMFKPVVGIGHMEPESYANAVVRAGSARSSPVRGSSGALISTSSPGSPAGGQGGVAPILAGAGVGAVEGNNADDLRTPLLGQERADEVRIDIPEENDEDLDEDIPDYMVGRDTLEGELEDTIAESAPFVRIPLTRGKQLKRSQGADEGHAGYVKVRPKLVTGPSEGDDEGVLKQVLSGKEERVLVRVYVLMGADLTPADLNGKADPYLVLKFGKKVFSTKKNHLKETLYPKFFHVFEFKTTFPGPSVCEISVMDWDMIGTNDLIGYTSIDLEDRFYNPQWRAMEKKPVEFRNLWSHTSHATQGKLEMWVDMFTLDEVKKNPVWNITPPPPEPFEMRVIVYRTRKIPNMDTITNQSDLFVTVRLNEEEAQQTDIHWRAKKGVGNFNWRMKFPLQLPMQDARLNVAAFDKDITAASDAIGMAQMDITRLLEKAKKKKAILPSIKPEKMWLPLRHPNEPNKSRGEIQITVQVLPQARADAMPAGQGRAEPNTNPELPAPVRFQFNLFRPDLLLKELLGPALFYKIGGVICCVITIIIAIVLSYFILQILNYYQAIYPLIKPLLPQ